MSPLMKQLTRNVKEKEQEHKKYSESETLLKILYILPWCSSLQKKSILYLCLSVYSLFES